MTQRGGRTRARVDLGRISAPRWRPLLDGAVALALSTAIAFPALAQISAPLQVPPTERVLPPPQPQFSAPRPEIPPAVESAPEGPRVRVDQVVVDGASVYSDA